MCLGSISVLVDSWDAEGVRVGRLDTRRGRLARVRPRRPTGSHLLVHLGIPVEILDPDAATEALALRTDQGGHR